MSDQREDSPDEFTFHIPAGAVAMELDVQRVVDGMSEGVKRAKDDVVLYAILINLMTLMKVQMRMDDNMDAMTDVLEKQVKAVQLLAARTGMASHMFRDDPGTNPNMN